MNAASLTQAGFRGYADTGGEGTNPKAAENTDWSQVVDENFRVRFVVDETNSGGENNVNLQLQYNLNSGGWNNVTGSSSVVQAVASGQVTDEGATTRQLTSGSGTFLTGAFDEADGIAGSNNQIDFTDGQDEVTEVEYVLQILSGDVGDGDTLELRVVRSGGTLDAWTQTPSLTVSEGGGGISVPVAMNQYMKRRMA